MGDEPIQITIGELREAFITWENERRESPNEFRSQAEMMELPAGQIGVEAADHLWRLLKQEK